MLNIIPFPAEIEMHSGEFRLTLGTDILADEPNRANAACLHDLLAPPTGLPLRVRVGNHPAGTNSIFLRTNPDLASLGNEGYQLMVQPWAVMLEAPAVNGVFHAIQTLRQMLPVEIEARTLRFGVDWKIPCADIRDQPRFRWRGFMLDEGRHFHGMENIKLTLDLMALQKLNIFHWHLTEDQGWRIEIRKYPRLTEIGAWRAGTSQSRIQKKHDSIPHGGFYTRADIQEIVTYAAERHIQVIPEIEIPGHSLAALASYPQLSCTGKPFEVATRFGIFPDIYCPGKESTFTFLQTVLDEILDLFPSPIVHIGGDETPKTRWRNCPDCQRRIGAEGLHDEKGLQLYLTNRIAAYLESKGRRLMGWNQILQEDLAPQAVVQYWIGNHRKLVDAIRAGREVVMSTYLETYLDHSYNLMPLSRAYRYDPIPAGLTDAECASLLGLEFPLWTEWVPDRLRLDYQAYPRLTAMAETGWTPKSRKDFNDFQRRLNPFLKRLDMFGVRYASQKLAEPPKFKRWFGLFTIAQPQRKVAGR